MHMGAYLGCSTCYILLLCLVGACNLVLQAFRLIGSQLQPPLLCRFLGTLLRSSCALCLSPMATSSTSTSSEPTVGRAQVGILHQHCLLMSVALHQEAQSMLGMHQCLLAILAL